MNAERSVDEMSLHLNCGKALGGNPGAGEGKKKDKAQHCGSAHQTHHGSLELRIETEYVEPRRSVPRHPEQAPPLKTEFPQKYFEKVAFFLARKKHHPNTTLLPAIHHNFTTKNHQKITRFLKNP